MVSLQLESFLENCLKEKSYIINFRHFHKWSDVEFKSAMIIYLKKTHPEIAKHYKHKITYVCPEKYKESQIDKNVLLKTIVKKVFK